MKATLQPGVTHTFKYVVAGDRTVPHLYPNAPELASMPEVFATGFLVALIEWTCIQAIAPHLDGPDEQSVGIGMNLTHTAATPPGFTVTVNVKLETVEGKKLTFSFSARDDKDPITSGTHERFVINGPKFVAKVNEKAASL